MKKPVNEVIKLMPIGFTDDMFVLKFRHCYEYLWIELQREWMFYQRKNKTFRGAKPLLFPSPARMTLIAACHLLKKARNGHLPLLTDDQKTELEKKLVDTCQKKLAEREKKRKQNTELLQNVVPNYADNMIQSYFFLRYQHRENVNGRYYILNEIAKFSHQRFIGFFTHVMSSEPNDICREFAFQTLQKWDNTVHLPKKSKRKKHPSDGISPILPTSPDELMELIERLQMERDKSYNVFVSHRSLDRGLIISVVNMLNRENLSAYVDWMIDKDGLPREMLNKKTLKILEVRMLHCDSLLYVHTNNSRDSNFIKWELDFGYRNNIPMAVLNIGKIPETERISMMPHVQQEGDKLFIQKDDIKISYQNWVTKYATHKKESR